MSLSRTPGSDKEEETSFLHQVPLESEDAVPVAPKQKRDGGSRMISYVRFAIEALMAAVIIYLLHTTAAEKSSNAKTLKSPVPELPRKIYTFQDNPRYLYGDMFFNETDTLEALHNWLELSSGSRGYVVIADADKYDLPDPYEVPISEQETGPGYMMSVFHQLHCLSYITEHYQQGFAGVKLTHEVAHHSAHCLNYLRQGIMCNADTNLEGKTEAGPGEGSDHECVDYDALLEWANDNSAWKWRTGLLPGLSTLS